MQITKLRVADLRLPEQNIRRHGEKQIKEFMRSVEMFGQIRPIIVDEDNTILCGNGLYETLVRMNHEYADCYIVFGLSPNQKKKLMIADNRIFDLGVDDAEVLDAFLLELSDDLDIPGYDLDDDLLSGFSVGGILDATEETAVFKQPVGDVQSAREESIAARPPTQTITDCKELSQREFSNEAFKYECPRCHFLFNE